MVRATDPLSYLSASVPTAGACLPAGTGIISGTTAVLLFPGTYCDGILLSGTGNVTFSAGVYIVTGGGIQFSGTGGQVSGTDVTFYNNGATAISDTGSQAVSLAAPTTGAYAGILLFQDAGDTQAVTIAGTGATSLAGSLYFPNAAVSIAAPSSTAAYTVVVAQGITFTGAANFGNDYSTLPGNRSPIRDALLVE
jgi:hypothetical protein